MSRQFKAIIVKQDGTGALLCNDGRFRLPAMYGTFPECVKFYRKKGWAEKLFQKYDKITLYFIYEGDEIDTKGNIHRRPKGDRNA